MKLASILSIMFTAGVVSYGQNVGINSTGTNPDNSAMLDVQSTTKGMLIPRMTTAQRTAIGTPATGLEVYDTSTGTFWYYNGTVWVEQEIGDDDWTVSGVDMYSAVSGNVGIGISGPTQKLDVQGGNARINNVFIGDVGHGAGWAGFANSSSANTGGYGLLQYTDGSYTLINKANTGTGYIGFRVGNTNYMAINNTGSVDIEKGVLFDCNDCGATNTIDGTSDWGDLVIQGRVLSTNSNLHLSPPGGLRVIIDGNYRSAGGAAGQVGLDVDGGIRFRKNYYYFQRYKSCSCYGAGAGLWDIGYYDFCSVAHVGFKNNMSTTDEDDDVQCAVYPTNHGGYGESTNYNASFTYQYTQRPHWRMYAEAYEDTNGVTCGAICINFD